MTKAASYVLLTLATLCAGCRKKVPAPWNEWGIPSENLTEVFASTSMERFSAVYDVDPREVISSFRLGLAKGGFAECGGMVVDGQRHPKEGAIPFKAVGFLKKDGAIWEVKALEQNAERTLVSIQQLPARTIADIEAKRSVHDNSWVAWNQELDRSACLPPAKEEPAPVPAAALSAAAKVEPASAGSNRSTNAGVAAITTPPSSPAITPPRTSALQITGPLATDTVQKVVRANGGRARLCYENGLRANPALKGKMVVKVVVGPSGAVTSVSDGGSDLPDPAVVACVTRAFSNLQFPQTEGTSTFVYPMTFSP